MTKPTEQLIDEGKKAYFKASLMSSHAAAEKIIEDYLTSAFHTIEEQGYERGKKEKLQDITKFDYFFTAEELDHRVNFLIGEAIEQTRNDYIAAVKKERKIALQFPNPHVKTGASEIAVVKGFNQAIDVIVETLSSLHKQD